jgi:hypothetical protein
MLTLAISTNRTLINNSSSNFCRKHAKIVDQNHSNYGDCLTRNLTKQVIYYNFTLKKTSLNDLEVYELWETLRLIDFECFVIHC